MGRPCDRPAQRCARGGHSPLFRRKRLPVRRATLPEKGIESLLQAAEKAGVAVTVAGTGPSESALRASFPRRDFIGHVDTDTIAARLREVIAAVVPSIWFENAPLSVLEPMALGVPVIASQIGGIPEMIDDGQDGLLVPPGDVDALATALRHLDEDRDRARHLGARALERVKRDNDPTAHRDGLLEIYRQATEGGMRT